MHLTQDTVHLCQVVLNQKVLQMGKFVRHSSQRTHKNVRRRARAEIEIDLHIHNMYKQCNYKQCWQYIVIARQIKQEHLSIYSLLC